MLRPLVNHSLFYSSVIECQTNYVIDAIQKLVKSGSRSMDVKKEKFDSYQVLNKLSHLTI